VPEWQQDGWSFQDIAIDPEKERLYLISPATDELLIYDLNGVKQGVLRPEPPNNLEGASALTLANGKLYVACAFSDRVQTINLPVK
jgi:DNA-binding beta-propeller fold protein YncE